MNRGEHAGERFRALVEVLRDGVTLWDEDGRLILANPAFWEICGADPDDGPAWLSTPGWRVVDEDGADVPVEDHPVARALRDGETVTGRILGVLRPDGRRVWVSVSAAPSTGPDGRPEAVASIADVTARQEAREAIRARRDLLSSMIDAVPDPLFLRDADGCYLAVNQAFCDWCGRPREEILGRTPDEVAPAEWRTFAAEALGRVVDGAPSTVEAHDAARGRTWRVTRVPWFGAAGDLAGLVTVATDVSDYRALEEGLRRANADLEVRVAARTAELARAYEELEAFSYRVSHDLRAPLRAIEGFSRSLEDELGDGAPGDLRRIRDGAEVMTAMIGALLELSQAGRRAGRIAPVPVDLGALAHEARADLAETARAAGVRIEIGDLPTWPGDGPLLRQVFANLLSNAVKFCRPGGGTVTVAAHREADGLVVSVRDDGVGFGPGDRADAIFGAFERLPNAIGVEGTGIGLAIVQRAVTAHGGRVWAEAAPGGGAVLAFRLPATDP